MWCKACSVTSSTSFSPLSLADFHTSASCLFILSDQGIPVDGSVSDILGNRFSVSGSYIPPLWRATPNISAILDVLAFLNSFQTPLIPSDGEEENRPYSS